MRTLLRVAPRLCDGREVAEGERKKNRERVNGERESGGSSKAKKKKKRVVYRLCFEGALCKHTPLMCVQLRLATQISHKCGKLLQLLGNVEAFRCSGLWCNFLRDAVNIFECRLKESNALLS